MRVVAILMALTLSGCAMPVYRMGGSYQFDADKNEGVVVASIRVQQKACPGNLGRVWVEGLNTRRLGEWSWIAVGPFTKNDFENPPGSVHILRMPADQWRFAKFMYGHFEWNNLDLLFTVKPGVVTYLGEINIDMVSCSRFTMTVKDERVRDGALFDAHMKHMSSRDFQAQLLVPPKRKQ